MDCPRPRSKSQVRFLELDPTYLLAERLGEEEAELIRAGGIVTANNTAPTKVLDSWSELQNYFSDRPRLMGMGAND